MDAKEAYAVLGVTPNSSYNEALMAYVDAKKRLKTDNSTIALKILERTENAWQVLLDEVYTQPNLDQPVIKVNEDQKDNRVSSSNNNESVFSEPTDTIYKEGSFRLFDYTRPYHKAAIIVSITIVILAAVTVVVFKILPVSPVTTEYNQELVDTRQVISSTNLVSSWSYQDITSRLYYNRSCTVFGQKGSQQVSFVWIGVGVISKTDWDKTLTSINDILKPSGFVYNPIRSTELAKYNERGESDMIFTNPEGANITVINYTGPDNKVAVMATSECR